MKEHFTADLARYILYCAPDAIAWIAGTEKYPKTVGKIYFWEIEDGVFVEVEIAGLPIEEDRKNDLELFSIIFVPSDMASLHNDSIELYNQKSSDNQNYMDILPSIISNNGIAWYTIFTSQFKISDIVGSTARICSKSSEKINQQSPQLRMSIASGMIKYNQY